MSIERNEHTIFRMETSITERFPHLMKLKPGTSGSGQRWSLENLRDGLQYFFELNNRYPKATEVDAFGYLPSSRAIQRSYGGLVELRTKLGIGGPTHFGRGETRSAIATVAKKRAQDYEEAFYNFLISKITEVRIHEQKVFRPGNVQCDFFIYGLGREGIILDLFYAENLRNLAIIINIKVKRYSTIKSPVYFILVENEAIQQSEIDVLVKSKKNELPNNIHIETEKIFKETLNEKLEKIGGVEDC